MAKRNAATPPEYTPPATGEATPPFAVDPPTDAPEDDFSGYQGEAGANPLGIQSLSCSRVKPYKSDDGVKKIILSIELDEPEFDGVEIASIWLEMNGPKAIARNKRICRGFGVSWDSQRNWPVGGWPALNGRRARGIIVVYEAKDEWQCARFTPMFTDTETGKAYRDAFVTSCNDAGFACEVEVIPNGKYAGQHRVKSKLFVEDGILPVAEG